MDVSQISDALRDGVGVAVRLSAPILLLGMFVGIIMAILQAVTQIHEQSISFVLKLAVVLLFLVLGGGWMLRTLQEYAQGLMAMLVSM